MRTLQCGLVALCICAAGFAQAPVNDECLGALPVTVGVNPTQSPACAAYTNVGATTSAGFGATCNTINSDVWFHFTPSTSCSYNFDTSALPGCPTTGQLADTVLLVYNSCGATSAIGCDDDSGLGFMSSLTLPLVAGQTYFIRVGDFGTTIDQGTFNLTVTSQLSLFISSPAPGCAQVNINCGTPNGNYFFVATAYQGAFPGYFFGLDIPFQEVVNLFNAGAPWKGTFNGSGNAQIGPVCGLPAGVTVNAVALDFGTNGYSIPQASSNVVTFTTM
jgi:hypothetical protein